MGADYLLPGSVLILKFMFKLFVGHSPRLTDWLKALITFPVDMTFLGFSFGAATVTHAGRAAPAGKALVVIVLVGVICAIATTVVARSAEHQLDLSRPWRSTGLTAIGYLVAGLVVYLSFAIGGTA